MMKKFLLYTFLLVLFPVFSFGQSGEIKEKSKTVFRPHAYLQLQGGAAHTLGEAKFTDLISPALALNLGYKFSPVFGLRLGASGWQGKGGWVAPAQVYDFQFVQGNLDVVLDLASLFGGFNPQRAVTPYIFGGGAYAYGFENDKANGLNTGDYQLEYLWKDSRGFLGGRFGLGFDFRLSDAVALTLEGNATLLDDRFNSKKAGNPDWQFNVLAGIKINLGKTYKRTEPVYYEPQPAPAPAPAPVPAPAPLPVEEEAKPAVIEPLDENIFFAINSTIIRDDQAHKIDDIVAYMEQYPLSKITITGYADADTGNNKINMRLSEGRAKVVAAALEAKGISSGRITVDYKGDTIQPFNTPEENRVAVCITR